MHLNQRSTGPETLPYELAEQIITEAWLSSMSSAQRAAFMKAILCASKSWSVMLTKISTRYLYISSSLLGLRWWSFDGSGPSSQRGLAELSNHSSCFSPKGIIIALKITDNPWSSTPDRLRRKAFREVFTVFQALSYTPDLRSFVVEFFDPTETKAFITTRLSVIRMEVEYTFPNSSPRWLIEHLGLSDKSKKERTRHSPWDLPDIYHVSSPTPGTACLGGILMLLPHLEPSQESFGIIIKILSTSENISHKSFLLHGPLSDVYGSTCATDFEGQLSLKGMALGVVLEVDSPLEDGRPQNPTHLTREVHVLKEKIG